MIVKLVVFDVDGIFVKEHSSWEYLHKVFDVTKYSTMFYEMKKQGRIDYYDWMYLDTLLWNLGSRKGYVAREEIVNALEKIELNRDMIDIALTLKDMGKKIVLLSGGIDLLVERIGRMLKADFWISNILVFDRDDKLVPGGIPVVPARGKGIHMKLLRSEYGISKEETVFVGDSIWDREAFTEAGLPILFDEYNTSTSLYGACVKADNPHQILELINDYEENKLSCADTN